MKVKYYTPVVKEGNKYFSVNGGTSKDKDEAIRLTKKHVAFRNPDTVIIRIDVDEQWED